MPSEHILRIARDDEEGRYILMNVSSSGPSPLDLKLLATEGESPYVLYLKQSDAKDFRACSSHLDENQWEALLQSILLQEPISGGIAITDSLETLEITTNITEETILVIIRKSISGITKRLGELRLYKDEEEEIDSVSWAGTAVIRCNELEKAAKDLNSKFKEQGKTIEKLNRQLEDLITAKNEHENSLLEKFRDLLNAKKLKIRDLHRALAAAKVEPQDGIINQDAQKPSKSKMPATARTSKRETRGTRAATISSASHSDEEKASNVKTASKSSKSKGLVASRPNKRKAKDTPAAADVPPSDSDEETASENMSVDQEEEHPPVTPERSDESETEDGDDDLDSVPVSQPVRKEQHKASSRSEAPAKLSARASTPPPRRDLPFRKPVVEENSAKNLPALGRQQSAMDVDDEETSDDEL